MNIIRSGRRTLAGIGHCATQYKRLVLTSARSYSWNWTAPKAKELYAISDRWRILLRCTSRQAFRRFRDHLQVVTFQGYRFQGDDFPTFWWISHRSAERSRATVALHLPQVCTPALRQIVLRRRTSLYETTGAIMRTSRTGMAIPKPKVLCGTTMRSSARFG